jgi:hypothetical protein
MQSQPSCGQFVVRHPLQTAPIPDLARIARPFPRRPELHHASANGVHTAQALLTSDSAGFTRSLPSHLRYYRMGELNPRLVTTAMSDEGTVLRHFARRRGLEVGEIPEDLMPMIPRP